MRDPSPLRYPGGKQSMAGLLAGIRKLNGLGRHSIAEPFAGGAGASLKLLYLEEADNIHINDADPAIHAFWWTLVNRPRPFLELLKKTPVSIHEWREQRATYRTARNVSRLRRGFSAFYLNRCNRSGIIRGGPIGGVGQAGKWKLDARYVKTSLRERCERISEYRKRIRVSGEDGLRFIGGLEHQPTFFFIDPPYFKKGPCLYLNSLDKSYHEALAKKLKGFADGTAWVLTYDDCPEIRRLYEGWATVRPFSLKYSAASRRTGGELLIAPRWMELPMSQGSMALAW